MSLVKQVSEHITYILNQCDNGMGTDKYIRKIKNSELNC